jgi:hypothetical protein
VILEAKWMYAGPGNCEDEGPEFCNRFRLDVVSVESGQLSCVAQAGQPIERTSEKKVLGEATWTTTPLLPGDPLDVVVRFTVVENGRLLRITVANEGGGQPEIYDSIHADNDALPSLLEVEVSDTDGRLLTKDKLRSDGSMGPNRMESSFVEPPVGLTALEPGQILSKDVGIPLVLSAVIGLHPDVGKQDQCYMRFRLSLYTDEYLTESHSWVSDWIRVDVGAILKDFPRPKPLPWGPTRPRDSGQAAQQQPERIQQ